MNELQTHHFGHSMLPLLQNRDILHIVSAKEIRKGNIILFKDENKEYWIAHRVVKIENKIIYTKGDNNLTDDETTLSLQSIMGVVTARWRNGKKLKIYQGKKAILQYHLYLVYTKTKNILKKGIGDITAPKIIMPAIHLLLPRPKEILFSKSGQSKRVLYLGKIHIGTYSDSKKSWQIRFPYRILYRVP